MRKILLSMALVAASGAYVGYENLAAATAPAATAALPSDPPAGSAKVPPLPAAAPAVGSGAGLSWQAAPSLSATTGSAIPTIGMAAPAAASVPSNAFPDAASTSSVPLPRLRPTEVPAAEATSAPAQAATRYHDGTFKGTDASAYYGHVQVEAVIKGGHIAAVNVLDYPSDRRTSRYINSQALPALEQEAIQAQSASIDAVSGATLTSEAFAQSLDAALSAAAAGSNA